MHFFRIFERCSLRKNTQNNQNKRGTEIFFEKTTTQAFRDLFNLTNFEEFSRFLCFLYVFYFFPEVLHSKQIKVSIKCRRPCPRPRLPIGGAAEGFPAPAGAFSPSLYGCHCPATPSFSP